MCALYITVYIYIYIYIFIYIYIIWWRYHCHMFVTNSFFPIENDVTLLCFIDTGDEPNSDIDTLVMYLAWPHSRLNPAWRNQKGCHKQG